MIPDKYKFLIIFISVLLGCAASFYAGKWFANTAWEKTYADHLLLDSRVNEKAATDMMDKQRDYQLKLNEAQNYVEQLEQEKLADLDNSNVANDGLQHEFDRIKKLPQAGNCSTVSERATAATDRLVFTELLEWTHEAYRKVAIQADANRKAGLMCEIKYDAAYKVCM